MTPAIDLVKRQGIAHAVHAYDHDPDCASYGTEVAERLGLDDTRIFKTLVVDLGERGLGVAVLPVACQLSMKRLAKAAGVKKASMAEKRVAERATGYVLGGVSPLGQKKRLPTFIHTPAGNHPTIFVSAGRRGLEIELAADDLRRLTGGRFVTLCQTD